MNTLATCVRRAPQTLSAVALSALLVACGGGTEPETRDVAVRDGGTLQAAAGGGDVEEAYADLYQHAPVDWGMGPGVGLTTLGRVSALGVGGLMQPQQMAPYAPDAHLNGVFGEAFTWPVIPIHTTLLPDGRVLSFGTNELGQQSGLLRYAVWNPALGTGPDSMQLLDNKTGTDIFCAGQALQPNGNVLLVGGDRTRDGFRNYANEDVNVFNPLDNSLTKQAPMAYQRWYATVVTTAQGEQVVMGGRIDRKPVGNEIMTSPTVDTYASMPEVYTEGVGFRRLTSAVHEQAYGSKGTASWSYPRAWVAPDGNIVIYNSAGDIFSLNPQGTGKVTLLTRAGLPVGRYTRPGVMYAPGKILSLRDKGVVSTIDVNAAKPIVGRTADTAVAGEYANATVLADGKVWANGGSTGGNTLAGASYQSQMWNPADGTWTSMATAAKPRIYHSVSMLLPDGTVLTGGGGAPGPVINMNAEIYYPPYLFKTDGSGEFAARPEVVAAPGSATWGDTLAVQLGEGVAVHRVSLVRFGSVTHAFNNDQRFQSLAFTQDGTSLAVQVPGSGRDAPPGFYMLFVLDAQGVPSVAKVVRIA